MRIVGGNDYYDSASAYGIDPGVTFVRDSKILTNEDLAAIGHWAGAQVSLVEDIETPENPPRGWRKQSASWGGTYYSSHQSNVINGVVHGFVDRAVIFCGKVYRGITITTRKEHVYTGEESFHFWSADKLRKWAAERGLVADSAGGWWRGGERPPLDEMFTPTQVNEKVLQALIDRGISIAYKKEDEQRATNSQGVALPYTHRRHLDSDSGWRSNTDGLKDFGFQSAIDPVTAFQELSMWVGGTLSAQNGPNVVTITDDNVKLAKHGMDKWSFRKQGAKSKL